MLGRWAVPPITAVRAPGDRGHEAFHHPPVVGAVRIAVDAESGRSR